jgi:DNA-directed RNA polymerase specialized sigma24 family protein
MLGSRSNADDAVQESWLRLDRADTGGVKNLAGWPMTVAGCEIGRTALRRTRTG